MTWYMIYATADGRPVSSGSVVPENLLPAGKTLQHPEYGQVVAAELPHQPDWSVEQWNPQTLQLEPITG